VAQAPLRNQPLLTPEQLRSRLGEFFRALQEFNDRYYFESHETLEDLWQVTPWPERQLFQGVIQLAAAFVHVVRNELPGAIRLLDAAADKLRDFAPESLGVDVTALVGDIARCRGELMALGPDGIAAWDDEERAPRIRFQALAQNGAAAKADRP